MTRLEIEEKVVKMLKTVYDPEIPVEWDKDMMSDEAKLELGFL